MSNKLTSRASTQAVVGLRPRMAVVVGAGLAAVGSVNSFGIVITSGGWSRNGSKGACSELSGMDYLEYRSNTRCEFDFFPLGVELRASFAPSAEIVATATSWWLSLALLVPLLLLVAATVLAWLGVAPERAQSWVLQRPLLAKVGLLAAGTVLTAGVTAVAFVLAVMVHVATT